MKNLMELVVEADNLQSQLMMFKRLLDQVAKTPQEKIQALQTLSNLVLGPQDVKQLSKALISPPPLPSAIKPGGTQTTSPAATLAGTQA